MEMNYQDEEMPKLQRLMFARLHQAKMASNLFTQWKIKYLEKFLNMYMEQLHNVNL
jgi:hypothetical protein